MYNAVCHANKQLSGNELGK